MPCTLHYYRVAKRKFSLLHEKLIASKGNKSIKFQKKEQHDNICRFFIRKLSKKYDEDIVLFQSQVSKSY